MNRGAFITIEGVDGVGKGTQLEFIYQYLQEQNIEFISVREPGGTEIGEQIRKILLLADNEEMTKEAELLLFNAARAQLVNEVIKPNLAQGIWVISDRFYDSTVAYQVGGRGLPEDYARKIIEFACQGLKPDLSIYLDLDPEIASARLEKRDEDSKTEKDRMESQDLNFKRRVRAKYLEIAENEPRIKTVSAEGNIEKVSAKIKKILQDFILKYELN